MEKDVFYERLLLLGCQGGDSLAYRELVEYWQPRLYYYVRRIVQEENAVWDVIQEAWLAVLRNVRALKDPRKFPTWLYRIARHKAIDYLRKEKRYTHMTDEDLDEFCESDPAPPAFEENIELVHKLLGRLSLAHREALTLYFLEEFSIPEMAEILGISEGTVKSRLYHAKKKLLDIFGREADVRM
jgi:RNA polymerase sigma-70 factor (ECF subfamily)